MDMGCIFCFELTPNYSLGANDKLEATIGYSRTSLFNLLSGYL